MIISGLKSLRGLIIDDHPVMRQLMRDILASVGISKLDTAASGAQGLEMLGRSDYQFVFVDWEMGEMSGLDFVKAVRRPEMGPNAFVPIIMVTSHSEQEKVIEARNAGIHDYLVKPFTAKGLLQRLQDTINNPRKFIMTEEYFGPAFRTKPAVRVPTQT